MSTNLNLQRRMPPVPPSIYNKVVSASPKSAISIPSGALVIPASIQHRIPQPPPPRQPKKVPMPPKFPKPRTVQTTQTTAPAHINKPLPLPPSPRAVKKIDASKIVALAAALTPAASTIPRSESTQPNPVQNTPEQINSVAVSALPTSTVAPNPLPISRPATPSMPPRRSMEIAVPSAGMIVRSVPYELPKPKSPILLDAPIPRRVFVPIPLAPSTAPKSEPVSQPTPQVQPIEQQPLQVSQPESMPTESYTIQPASEHRQPLTAWDESDLHQRVHRSVKRTKAADIFKAVVNSRIFSSVILSGLAVAGFFGVVLLFGLTPPGWVVIAVAAAGFAIGFLWPRWEKRENESTGTLASLRFEWDALKRMNTEHQKKFRAIDIFDKPANAGTLYTGSLPHRNEQFGEYLANEKMVGAVLSADKLLEKLPIGVSLPLRHEDWADLAVTYGELNVDDRQLLSLSDLELGAQFIHAHLSSGDNVYVSGKAGRQAIVAYLLKYYPWRSLDEAMEMVGESRPKARALLEQYYDTVTQRGIRASIGNVV